MAVNEIIGRLVVNNILVVGSETLVAVGDDSIGWIRIPNYIGWCDRGGDAQQQCLHNSRHALTSKLNT